MKFLADTVSRCAPRLGVLRNIDSKPEFNIETPLAMLYTRGGSIPHITHEIFQICCKEPQIIQIPIVSTYQFQDAMSEFPGRISEFVGLRDCVTCVTVQDPGDLTQPGHRYKDHVPLWTRSGKILLNASKYMDIIEAFKPDIYYLLSDGDTNIASATKRISKSVENTLDFINKCLERHKRSNILNGSFVIVPVAGGYSLKGRERSIEGIADKEDADGFLIDGLHNNGPEVEFLPFEEVKPVVEFVNGKLPGEKLKTVQGCWNPVTVVKLVQLGVDVFDTSYCHIVTERSSALTFALDPSSKHLIYEINLRDARYADDFRPLLPGCTCLACSKHSRGYIYHLVAVQELLGPLLLTIHNIHHYMKFFEGIRRCIKEKSLDELERLVSKQFEAHQREVFDKKEKEAIVEEN